MSKKLIALLLAAMMMLSLAAACGNDAPTETPTQPSTPAETPTTPAAPTTPAPTEPADPDADKYGGDLVVATSYVSNTLDPHNVNGVMANYQWMQYIFEVPLAHGADGQVYPLICDYEQSEDGLTLKLTVREYYFHNGNRVTAEDVMASFERAAVLNSSFQSKHWGNVVDKTIEGDTITLKLAALDVNLLWDIADSKGPCYILPKSLCEKYSGGALIEDIKELVGTGPYMLESYRPDTAIKMIRNENYVVTENAVDGPAAPRKAYCDTITYAVNTDSASLTAAMIAGDYHVGGIMSSMQAYAEQIGLKRTLLENQWTHAIFFNLHESNADSPVADVNFRKAFRAALDMNAIMLSVMSGDSTRYVLNCSPVTPLNTAYHNNILESTEWNIADKELAKQYLAKTNYNGEPIVWLCSSGSAFYRAAMAAIPMLEEVGINVELQTVDSGSHSGLRGDPANGHDIGAWETQKAIPNPVGQNNFVIGSAGGWWENTKKTELVEILKTTPTGSEASVQAYKDFCQLVADEVPWIGFGTGLTATYTQPNVELNYQGIMSYYWNAYFTK